MAQEDIILKVGVQSQEGTQNLKSLKQELKDIKLQLEQVEEGSQEFKVLANRAAEAQDKLNMVNQTIKSLADNKLNKGLTTLSEAGTAIAGGFQAAQGAAALFGTESEKVQKAIQNVVAVQGIMNGVQAINNALQDDAILGIALRTAAEKVALASTKAWTAAQRALNVVMSANPIGLIITGIGLLVGAIIAFAKPIKDFISNWDNLRLVMLALLGPIGWIIIAYEKLFGVEAQQAKQREKEQKQRNEAHKERIRQIHEERAEQEKAFNERQTQYDLTIARMEAEGKSSYKLRLQKLEDILAEKKAVLQSNIDIINATVERYQTEAALRGKSLEDFLTSIGIQYDTTKKQLEDSLQSQKDAIYQAETDVIALKHSSNSKQTDDKKKALEEQLKLEQDQLKNLKQQRDQFLQEVYDLENEF